MKGLANKIVLDLLSKVLIILSPILGLLSLILDSKKRSDKHLQEIAQHKDLTEFSNFKENNSTQNTKGNEKIRFVYLLSN